jgi:hypothetical protein
MNLIAYWKTGDYSDVYNVDEVRTPTEAEPYLRTIKKLKNDAGGGEGEFETARFREEDLRGWQIFLTLDDVRRGYRV